MALSKTDIVNSFHKQIGIPKAECVQITETLFEIMKEELEKGNSLMISGFGKWTVRAKRKRRGRNPQTGEQMMIDARKVVTFKPSPDLRDKVNGDE